MLSLPAKRVSVARLRPALVTHRRRTAPAYDGHIPLNWAENAFMAVGSALTALVDPRRGGKLASTIFFSVDVDFLNIDMVAALGETTAGSFLPRLRDEMVASAEGRAILKHRPRVNTDTLALKVFELANFRLPSTALSALSGLTAFLPPLPTPTTLVYKLSNPKRFLNPYDKPPGEPKRPLGRLTPHQRDRFVREFVPWALRCGAAARPLITVFWEKRWDQPVEDLKRELGIWDPPLVEWGKSLTEAKRARERRAAEASNP
ncbi:Ubiquinone biosynthesis protein [Ceratobasidium sp. 428]|nr:Ubiquinone biosynthesis protein [Ceratobasidium sp. 428]